MSPQTVFVPASQILDAARHAPMEDNKNCQVVLLNWVLVVDEIRLWLASVFCALQLNEAEIDTPTRVKKFAVGGLCASLNSTHLLVESGFDVSAKAIARNVTEYCDILHLLFKNDNICEEFFLSVEPEEANKFWHRHMSRNKLRRNLRASFLQEYPNLGEAFGDLDRYFQSEALVLSTASHPSYLAAAMASMSGGSKFGIFGTVDVASVRTIKVIFYYLFELITMQGKALDNLIALVAKDDNPFAKMAVERKAFVYQLALYVATKRDELPLELNDNEPEIN